MRKTDASVGAGLVVLTALWIVLAIVDTGSSHVRRRGYWFSLLIGMLSAGPRHSSTGLIGTKS